MPAMTGQSTTSAPAQKTTPQQSLVVRLPGATITDSYSRLNRMILARMPETAVFRQ
jgi:hypothetical protein